MTREPMAHELTQMDAVIMFSGILLAVSLFALGAGENMPQRTFGLRGALGAVLLGLGKAFWTIWFLICFTFFAGGFVMKFKYHKETLWNERETSAHKPFLRQSQAGE